MTQPQYREHPEVAVSSVPWAQRRFDGREMERSLIASVDGCEEHWLRWGWASGVVTRVPAWDDAREHPGWGEIETAWTLAEIAHEGHLAPPCIQALKWFEAHPKAARRAHERLRTIASASHGTTILNVYRCEQCGAWSMNHDCCQACGR